MEIVEADEESEEPGGDQTFGWSMDRDKDGPRILFSLKLRWF